MISTKTTKKLTQKQQIFVNEIAKGNTQRQACIIAYPKAKNWTQNTIDVRASQLMGNTVIQEELQKINNIDNTEALWTRQKVINIITELIENKKEEIKENSRLTEILTEVKETEIKHLKELLYTETDKKIKRQLILELQKEEKELLKIRISPTITSADTNALLGGLKMIIKMYGFNAKPGTVVIENEESDNMLTVEELRQMVSEIQKEKENI